MEANKKNNIKKIKQIIQQSQFIINKYKFILNSSVFVSKVFTNSIVLNNCCVHTHPIL